MLTMVQWNCKCVYVFYKYRDIQSVIGQIRMITITYALVIVWGHEAPNILETLRNLNDKSRKQDGFKKVEEVKTLLFLSIRNTYTPWVQKTVSEKDDLGFEEHKIYINSAPPRNLIFLFGQLSRMKNSLPVQHRIRSDGSTELWLGGFMVRFFGEGEN